MDFLIKELNVSKIRISFPDNGENDGYKKGDYLNLSLNLDSLEELTSVIDHELQHIYINERGNETKDEYNTTINLIENTIGITYNFLELYYLSFEDEILANIHMFHREIGENHVKTHQQFLKLLEIHRVYNLAVKNMITIFDLTEDENGIKMTKLERYKNGIINQNNGIILTAVFKMDLDDFMEKAGRQIKKAGETYKRKLIKAFAS